MTNRYEYCGNNIVDFGEIFIPPNLEVPRPRVLPEFRRLAHSLRSGNVSILDAKTIYIPNLHYDGAGPDAYFWVGNGSEPNPFGIKTTSTTPDPSKDTYGSPSTNYSEPYSTLATNCRELLGGKLQVQWQLVEGGGHLLPPGETTPPPEAVEIQLSGRIGEDEYMAFGISGEQGRSTMKGGDVVVVFYDKEKASFRAVDYYLSALAQCDGKSGVCPDERLGGRNDVTLVSGERRSGITRVLYRRPFTTNEGTLDRAIPLRGQVNVIAAIGPLNSRKEANAHNAKDRTSDWLAVWCVQYRHNFGHVMIPKDLDVPPALGQTKITDIRIDFSSRNDHSCQSFTKSSATEDNGIKPWPIVYIQGETVFSARIGPTGGKRGYSAITGQPSWGIAWYINDMLIPEIYVERGQTYAFIVEGGNDRTNPARYHPFYITDSPEGGFGQKNEQEQRKQRVFAGVGYDAEGYPYPTAAGRYCEWKHKTIDQSATSETFEAYFNTLRLECDDNDVNGPAYLNWTVAEETPDLLYYQCYTHNNLGWKIHVVDPGYWSQQNKGYSALVHSFHMTIIIPLLLAMFSLPQLLFHSPRLLR
ncbi:hypothetical protein J437_LFUL002703 [Ladona fulva]|uniref:DOMON domain-containing protein n=1 Tax=Ladona fulva TaxID=123851 RepID=A0A8K0NSF0_LADFU|nr:hypothetical protein J437_LFUL002703 [Ladona fulva]